jgi:hypothetical protein
MFLGKAPSAFWLVILAAAAASAKDIYVSPTGNDHGSGSSSSAPLATIAAASIRAAAGDTVYLMSGQYNEAIIPVSSGTSGHPITYKSFGTGPAVISNVNVGIFVNSLAYLVFDGISVNGMNQPPKATVNSFVAIQNSNNIIVRNGNFKYANGWAGIDISGRYSADGRFWETVPSSAIVDGTTSFVTIEDNTIDNVGRYVDGSGKPSGDAIQVAYGKVQNILIQRNTISHGGHDLVEFDSNYGVLQDNTLNNSYRDIVGGDTGYRSIEVQGSFNVIQRNFMEHSRLGGGGWVAPLASIRGDSNIVRFNVLFDGISEGIGTWCGASSPMATNGRIYQNTLYELGGQGWSVWAYTGCETAGNYVFANNLVANSRTNPGTLNGVSHGGTVLDSDLLFAVTGGPGLVDIGLGPTGQSVVKGNLFAPSSGGQAYVFLMGTAGRVTLSAAGTSYPQLFAANVVAQPVFMNASPKTAADLQLQSSSAGVSAGSFLTNAVGSGSASNLVVQDSKYFSDGNGVNPGDTIELQGSNVQARIISIDHASNTLTLSSPLTFKDGQGVSLRYSGNAPDIGAGAPLASSKGPLPPTNLKISH